MESTRTFDELACCGDWAPALALYQPVAPRLSPGLYQYGLREL